MHVALIMVTEGMPTSAALIISRQGRCSIYPDGPTAIPRLELAAYKS